MKSNEQYINEIFQKYNKIKNTKEEKNYKKNIIISPINTFFRIVTIMLSWVALTGCVAYCANFVIDKVFIKPKVMTYQDSIKVNDEEKKSLISKEKAEECASLEMKNKFNKTPGNIKQIELRKDSISYEPRWIISVIAIATIIITNMKGKGMIKITPILISIAVSYLIALCLGWTNPYEKTNAIMSIPPFMAPKFDPGAILTCVVVALAAVIEHIGDIAAIGETCGKNFFDDPGLVKTFIGDGLGTTIAGFLGGPANTTYSENTGVVALTRVYDPFVIRIAAVITLVLSLFPSVDSFIRTIPSEVIGGVSFVLYGMISAVGFRTLVDNKIDFSNQRNIFIIAIIMVSGLAFNTNPIIFNINNIELSFGGLASAAILGIILNLILPGNDYELVY